MFIRSGFVRVAIIAGFVGAVWAQPVLTLSSGSGTRGGSVALNLSLSSPSGSEPSALEWTFSYPAASVASITIANGASLTAAGKSITCNAGTAYTCIAYGINSNVISNGVVGIATLTLTSGATTAAVGITNPVAATAAGASETVTATGGTITVTQAPVISSLSCNSTSIGPAATSTCTVNLSGAAPAGGTTVSLSSSVSSLSVPASITVAAGSSTANFIASAGAVASNQTATITATLNNTAATAAINLVAAAMVSTVQCTAASIMQGGSTSCTVTLNKAAPTGGSVVALSSSVAGLSVPQSVTVSANATSASFNINATTVSSNQTARITATLNGSSANATVQLVVITVSSVQCGSASLFPNASVTCTVTIGNTAPTAGAVITLSSSTTWVTVPGSVTIPANTTSATFAATGGNFTSGGSASITAAINNSSATGTVTMAVITISSVQCGAASLFPNASVTCTVTIANAAPMAGAVITLSSSTTWVTVPGSVTIPANATSATFAATGGNFTTGGSASIMAAINNSSAKGTITMAVATISSVQCSSGSIYPSSSLNCTVTLRNAAPSGGVSIRLSSSTTWVAVPASVTVPANATSANFALSAGRYPTAGSATITATVGSSSASATVRLSLAPTLSSGFVLNGTASELSGPLNGAIVTPSSGPSGVTGQLVVNGTGSVNFNSGGGVYFLNCCSNSNNAYYQFTGASVGNIFNLTQGQISFRLQSRYSFAQRKVSAANPRNAFDVIDGNGVQQFEFLTQIVGKSLVFNYVVAATTLSYTVPAGAEDALFGSGVNMNVMLQWDGSTASLYLNGALVKASSYRPPAPNWNASSIFNFGSYQYGYQSSDDIIGAFTVNTLNMGSLGPTGSSTSPSASSPQPEDLRPSSTPRLQSLSCSDVLERGSSSVCQLQLDAAAAAGGSVSLTSGSEYIRVPATVAIRAGQKQARFQLTVGAAASGGPVTITAQPAGDSNTLRKDVQVAALGRPELRVPQAQTITAGSAAQFMVIAPGPVTLAAFDLPAGAGFDASTGAFSWAPTAADLGDHTAHFMATDSLGLSTTKAVELKVVRETPANGPEILTVGETDQALAVHARSAILASVPSALYDGQPARSGDQLSLSVSGIDCNQKPASRNFQLRIGAAYATVNAVQAVENAPGVCTIDFTVPAGIDKESATVRLEVGGRDGRVVSSNTASIAIED